MKKFLLMIMIVFLLSTGCTAEKFPQSSGFYLLTKAGYREINPIFGSPDTSEYFDFIESDKKPKFFSLESFTEIPNVSVYNIETGEPVEHSFSREKKGGLSIEINQALENGFYCFSESDRFAPPNEINHWCFSVGVSELKAQLQESIATKLDPGLQGVFILTGNGYIPLIPMSIEDSILSNYDLDSLPVSLSRVPVIGVRSSEINPDTIGFFKLRPSIGVHYGIFNSTSKVSKLDSNCGAYNAGMEVGDKIIGVNGIEVTNKDEVLDLLAAELSYGEKIVLKVARNAVISEATVVADCINAWGLDDINSLPQEDYYSLYYVSPLKSGFAYCLSHDFDAGYCFVIE
ncbi:MAG TPA: hypothetical protein DD636_02030 [Anaerolineaceae bacterium]|jgi:hypothetical protein|nr:hypothetical protein [Anaerolineaceae bacterium]